MKEEMGHRKIVQHSRRGWGGGGRWKTQTCESMPEFVTYKKLNVAGISDTYEKVEADEVIEKGGNLH